MIVPLPAVFTGCVPPILEGQEDYLRELTRARKGITLEEIKADPASRGITVSKTAIWTILRKLGLSHKKSR